MALQAELVLERRLAGRAIEEGIAWRAVRGAVRDRHAGDGRELARGRPAVGGLDAWRAGRGVGIVAIRTLVVSVADASELHVRGKRVIAAACQGVVAVVGTCRRGILRDERIRVLGLHLARGPRALGVVTPEAE